MSRPIQFSVPRRAVETDHLEEDGPEQRFLSAVADVGAGVELFDPRPRSLEIAHVNGLLAQYGLSIDTIHGRHLQPLLTDDGPTALVTRLRAEHLASVIDVVPDKAVTPAVSTHHLPRLWPDGDIDAETARRRTLENFIVGLDAAEPDPTRAGLDADHDERLITATVAFENVARKSSHEYLCVTPTDVRRLRETAAELGVADRLAFTCDVTHARDPRAMLDAMGEVVNVHLHGKVPAGDPALRGVRTRDGWDAADVGYEDEPGVRHHLPPTVGEPEMPAVFDALDDHDYDGPITIELHRAVRTPAVVESTVDAIRAYL